MADNSSYNVISKNNPGVPAQLDWESLRAAGLDYLGKLGGKIWTDHNVHDPGITMLEVLCYAITDLAYRSSLPIEEILARNPAEKTKDDNFFTPAEILTNNPTTINDFRKMLVDIDGVRNAWLEDAYPACAHPEDGKTADKETACSPCLNGLYHVLIEPEKFREESDPDDFYSPLIERIRKELMAHRNLCEDFVDIRILCRKKFGLCANIELEAGADAEQVYSAMLQKLLHFFSPSPQFYTLQQLLEQKHLKMEEIFSGRPYNWNESHGFVDPNEFGQLQLRKELHLSDVYDAIFAVPGVRDVKDLGWKAECRAGEKADRSWIWQLPRDHVPRFMATCSSFRFLRQNIEVNINQQHVATLFDLNAASTDRLSYRAPSPYLDAPLPRAFFRSDLGDYRSVQADLPRVYGIREGGLPPDASDQRKAQALQLKGYLLFYDQLLANFCAQLQNIRPLFALNGPKEKADRHTYFTAMPNEASDLDKLHRFSDSNPSVLGYDGDTVAVPVKMSFLNTWLNNSNRSTAELGSEAASCTWTQMDACRVSMEAARLDLAYGNKAPVVLAVGNACWIFYLALSTAQYVLLGSKTYESEQQARDAANLVNFAATYTRNYRIFIRNDGRAGFSIDLRMNHYRQFLGELTETSGQYLTRRNGFLDHLLSRFAEQFTDYALLSYGTGSPAELEQNEVEQKEKFLWNYPLLSANRGTAYDYLRNGWNNNNISGFERRTFAIAGMEDWKRKYSCNFVVEAFEEHYLLSLQLNNNWMLFSSAQKFYAEESAQQAAAVLFKAAAQRANYGIDKKADDQFRIFLCAPGLEKAWHPREFDSEQKASEACHRLFEIFDFSADPSQVVVSREVYRTLVTDSEDRTLGISRSFTGTEQEAENRLPKMMERVTRAGDWQDKTEWPAFQSVIPHAEGHRFTNLGAFHIMCGQWVEHAPGKYGFFVWDEGNHFRFNSIAAFDTEEAAKDEARKLILSLSYEDRVQPQENRELEKFELRVYVEDQPIAYSERKYESRPLAAAAGVEVVHIALLHVYSLKISRVPYRYKFTATLGHDPTAHYRFMSEDEFAGEKEALEGATKFYQSYPSVQVTEDKNAWMLTGKNGRMKLESVSDGSMQQQELEFLLQERKQAYALQQQKNPDFGAMVTNDIRDPKRKFVYRLVDKNHVRAIFRGGHAMDTEGEALTLKKQLYTQTWAKEYFELYRDQDAIVQRTDARTGQQQYYFQLRCANRKNTGFPTGLVLFESVKSYASQAEAVAAFNTTLLEILMAASREENYGKGKPIGFAPSDPAALSAGPDDSRNMVWVPVETQEKYQWYPNVIAGALSQLCRRYPIRYALKEDDEFYDLFPCEADERDPGIKQGCRPRNSGNKYYYFAIVDNNDELQWVSRQYSTDPAQVNEWFLYFLLLLKYPGNFCIERDFCAPQSVAVKEGECPAHWQVCLREVMAESNQRFESPQDAWTAVEEMIRVSQTEAAFQTWFNADECRFTFDIACNNMGFIHPCTYDTEDKARDAQARLIKPIRSGEWTAPMLKQKENGHWEWNDTAGQPVAELNIEKLEEEDFHGICEYILGTWIPAVQHGDYTELNSTYVLKYQNKELARSIGQWPAKEAWVHHLKNSVCYFPIEYNPENGKYYVNVKLPGFSCCGPEDWKINTCSADEEDTDCHCCSAWTSDCCFSTCRQAWSFFQHMLKQLADRRKYRITFDCECGPYHIQCHAACAEEKKGQDKLSHSRGAIPCCRETLAHNPQYFSNPRQVCQAVSRSKKLINAEGFHVIEHILLRPRCADDCRNQCFPHPCEKPPMKCTDWTWVVPGGENPCTGKEEDISFVPGADPFSFLATVVLPSWPERFRGKNKRAEIEQLLYREAPAHVMLRILWLKPADFCRIEQQFKSWVTWNALGRKGHCFDENPACGLVDLILGKAYEVPNDEIACQTCQPDIPETDSCFEAETSACDDRNVQLNISELYCWSGQQQRQEEIPVLLKEEPQREETVLADITATARNVLNVEAHVPTEKEKINFINSRIREKYEIVLNDLADEEKENRLEGDIRKFMTSKTNLTVNYEALVNKLRDIPKAMSKSGGKPLNRTDTKRLISIATESMFDKWLLFGADKKDMTRMGKLLESLRKEKWISKSLFHKWYDDSLEHFATGMSTSDIKFLATGEK